MGFGSTITDNVVTYLTYLDVDNADLSLRPGMTATATITATQRKDVLLVPNTALRFTPTAAAAGRSGQEGHRRQPDAAHARQQHPQVGRRRRQHRSGQAGVGAARWRRPVAVAVTPGISDGRMTEITGGDLQAGMQVITDQKAAAAK